MGRVCARLSSQGRRATLDSLKAAFVYRGLGPPSSFVGRGFQNSESFTQTVSNRQTTQTDSAHRCVGSYADGPTIRNAEPRAKPLSRPDRYARLVELCRRGPLLFEQLCDGLDMPPARARALISDAQADGIDVDVAHDQVGFPTEHGHAGVVDLAISPTVGERQSVAVISDTHLGSKYCMRSQLRDFVDWSYSRGIREILHPGDVLDGCYQHGVWELTHSGIEEQCRDLHETLPQRDGLTYAFVCGNHDETFESRSGTSSGGYLQRFMQERGRGDWKWLGNRSAFVRLRGVLFELWHPRGSPAYALSYRLQKHIEGYTAQKPQVLLTGHFHQFCYAYTRGVHALLCPTFQGSGSAFSKSLGGWQAQGGLVLSWELTELGMIRNFRLEPRFYYERETPVELVNELDAIAVPPQVSRPVAVLR